MTQTEKTSTWRDNEKALWLVRIGFLLQFYLPAILCCYIIPTSYPDRFDVIGGYFFFIGIFTLIWLVVECFVFTLVLRFVKLRFVSPVLGCLIVINALHSIVWLIGGWPMVLIRLIPPTVLYAAVIDMELITFFENKRS